MNYIRTKDGRIIDTTKIATGSKYMDFATNDESFKEIFKTEPLLKADTIEELCDEFVIEKKGYAPFVSQTIFYNGKEHKEDLKALAEYYSGYDNIYGAIWTDKGLIYVAKMNDKGELELI